MFDGLIGNSDVKTLLRRLVEKDRIPQAMMFCGIEGIGKKQFAFEIARAFVCTLPEAGLPCGKCSACMRTGRFTLPNSGKKDDYEFVFFGEHSDVGIVIPNKNTIYVEAIRKLVDEANYRPYEGRARVFIIDEAEKLSLTQKAAANALLKTLEEPAETTYIILITSNPSAIPQTIHSRCQTVRFSRVDSSAIEELLLRESEVSTGDAKLLARVSKGSILRASELDPDEYKEMRKVLLDVVDASVRGSNPAGMLQASETIVATKEREGFSLSINLLETLVRDIFLIKNGRESQIINSDIEPKLRSLAESLDPERLSCWIDEIETLKSNLRFNINRKIGADALFVSMATG